MSKASMKEMSELHGALAQTLQKFIQKPNYDPETGEELPPPASILNVARQFLKDNGVQSEAVKGNPLSMLSAVVLPFDTMKEADAELRKRG